MLNKGLSKSSIAERKKIEIRLTQLRQYIQSQRKEIKLSQEQLAEMLDVSVNTIKYVEQGRRIPSLNMLFKILWALELDFKITKHNTKK